MTTPERELVEELNIAARDFRSLNNATKNIMESSTGFSADACAILCAKSVTLIEKLIADRARLRERLREYGDAIDFACDHTEGAMADFLEDWRTDGAVEWDNFHRWRELQRTAALTGKDTDQ